MCESFRIFLIRFRRYNLAKHFRDLKLFIKFLINCIAEKSGKAITSTT